MYESGVINDIIEESTPRLGGGVLSMSMLSSLLSEGVGIAIITDPSLSNDSLSFDDGDTYLFDDDTSDHLHHLSEGELDYHSDEVSDGREICYC